MSDEPLTNSHDIKSSSSRGGGGRGRGRGSRGRGGGRRGRGRGGRGGRSPAATETTTASYESSSPLVQTTTTEPASGAVVSDSSSRPDAARRGHRSPQGRGRAGGRGRGRGSHGASRGRGGRGGRSSSPIATAESLLNTATTDPQLPETTLPPVLFPTTETAETTTTTPPKPTSTTTAPAVLNLPSSLDVLQAAAAASRGNRPSGVPMLLSRSSAPPPSKPPQQQQTVEDHHQHDPDAHMQHLSERLAEAALAEEDTVVIDTMAAANEGTLGTTAAEQQTAVVTPAAATIKKKTPKKKVKTPRKKKKNQDNGDGEDADDEAAVVPPQLAPQPDVSATDALQKLPAQQVSITASTQIKIGHTDSNNSLEAAVSAASKMTPKSLNKNRTTKKTKKGVLGNDSVANLKAARKFNSAVRACVERSDPDAMRELLTDRRNHNFALDATVLETVMKAYVMAAMFEDALYCLRNCTLPGTLSTLQTERILTCLPQNLRNSSAYTAADMINALCIVTAFESPTSRTYFLRIVRGISLEFLEEATSARDRICSSPCERLVRSALCVVNARLKRGKKAGELLVAPGDQLGVFVPDTMENRGIQAGDAVSILPYAGPYPMSAESLDRNMIEATVTNTNPMLLRLQDKTNAELYSLLTEPLEGNVYRIDKLANRMGFNRQLAAAVAMASPVGDGITRDPRRPCPQLIKAITAMDENIDRVMRRMADGGGGALARGELASTAALCAEPIPWNADDETEDMDHDALRALSRLALEKYGALEGLNGSQQLAVEGATTNRLTLVQGPPGTGKTMVAIRILQHWARLAAAAAEKGENPAPILATSDSNIAVDNLVEGCANAGLQVVRLGRPEAIRPELLRYCIDRPSSSSRENNSQQSYSSSAPNFKERAKQLKSAQIICCTCIGSGGDMLDALGPLERILVDEATQATEPAVLVPLMRGCRQLVLVGDHCQLPPTVLSTKAEEEGHGVPLFSRMVACGVPPYMLDTQYRMHPCIAMFPSDLFYGGLLRNGVTSPERRPLAGFPWPREEFPVAFMSVQGIEMDDGVSKYNQMEAEHACHAVQMLLEGGQCSVSDIAVVTPYAAQARLIRRMVRGLQQHTGPPFIEVSSVDGFQGREKEAVIFSAVRSNDYGAIGFTSDWRRVNVSFTRARRALIVIGNDLTLRRGDPDTWNPWLAWADAHGLNMDRPGQSRGRYDAEQLRRVRGGTTAAEMLKDVLERQQAQLKTAQQQQERAVRNAEGHIIATDAADDQVDGASTPKQLTLEEDLALMENTEGNWDDSDEEEKLFLSHSVSKCTLASGASSNDFRSSTPTDAWDL